MIDQKQIFFSWDKTKLDSDTKIGPKSEVKFIAAWFSLSRGTFGLTLKPKLMQIIFRELEKVFGKCLFDIIIKFPYNAHSDWLKQRALLENRERVDDGKLALSNFCFGILTNVTQIKHPQ